MLGIILITVMLVSLTRISKHKAILKTRTSSVNLADRAWCANYSCRRFAVFLAPVISAHTTER